MNNNEGALSFQAYIQTDAFKNSIKHMEDDIRGFSNVADRETKRMDASFSKLGTAIGGYLSFSAAKQFVSDIVKIRGEFQQLEVAFNTMLGSKGKADALMAQIIHTAAVTPFGLQEVAQGAKQLIAYGTAAEDVNGTLIRLGNIAAGLSVPLNDLIYLYGTSATQGRLMTQDLNQFAGRGVPIFQELAKVMGVSKESIKDLAAEGKIGFDKLQQVVQNLTNEGGMFFNLMQEQSKTVTGQISNLGDAWDQMLNKIGQSNEGVISTTIEGLATLVANYETVGKVLTALIATYGTYRAALIITSTLEAVRYQATLAQMAGYTTMGAITEALTAKMAALNAVMVANPAVAITTAVVALGTALWVANDGMTEYERAQSQVNDLLTDAKSKTEELRTETQSLLSVIQSGTASNYDQVAAYEKLKAQYPELLQNVSLYEFKLKSSSEWQKQFNQAINEFSMKDLQKQLKDAEAELDHYSKFMEQTWDFGENGFVNRTETVKEKIGLINTAIEERKRLEAEAAEQEKLSLMTNEQKIEYLQQQKNELEIQKSALETTLVLSKGVTGQFSQWGSVINMIRLDGLNSQIATITANLAALSGSSTNTPVVKNKTYYEGQKKKATETFESVLPGSEAYKQAKKDIEAANQALKQWDITSSKVSSKKNEIFPTGSVAEFTRQIKKAEEVLSKLNPNTQATRVKALQDTILNLTKQRTEAEKLIEVKSFVETLEAKKNKYLEYEKALETGYPQDSITQLYGKLLQGGKSYADFLMKQIIPLQKQLTEGTIGTDGMEKLLQLQVEYDTIMGKTSSIDLYKQKLDELKNSTASLTEYVQLLNEEWVSMSGDTSSFGIAATKEIEERRKASKIELRDLFKNFLIQTNTFDTKRKTIDKKYFDYLSQANKSLQGEQLEEAKNRINKQHEEELGAMYDEQFQQSDIYKKLNEEVLYYGRQQIKEKIANIQKALKEEKMSIETRKKLELELVKAKNDAENERMDNILQVTGNLSQMLGNMDFEFSDHFKVSAQQVIASINSISAAISGLNKINSGTASRQDKVNTGFAVADIINTAIVTVRNALLKDKHFESGMEGQEKELKILDSYLDSINYQLERQIDLLDDLYGEKRFKNAMELYDELGKRQEELFSKLQKFSLNVINSNDDTYIDPVFGTKVKRKGFVKFYTDLLTAGQALSTKKYSFGGIDTSTFNTLEDYKDLLLDIKLNGGYFNGKEVVESDMKALEAFIDEYDKLDEQRKQLLEETKQFYTGTTAESIADGIVDGFIQGKRSAADFANDFNKLMQQAVINSFKGKILDEALTNFYDEFYSLAGHESDFQLTSEEIDQLRKDWESMIGGMADQWEQLQQITGQNINGNTDQLSGIARSITEETGSALVGQFNAMRINQTIANEIMRNQLFHLSNIDNNTARLVQIEYYLRIISNNGTYSLRDLGLA